MKVLRIARHKQFGVSSEKIVEDAMEQLSFLFNEAKVYTEEKAEEPATSAAAHKRHKKHEYPLDNIPEGTPTEVVEHRLESEDLVCPEFGNIMTEIDKEVVNKLKIKTAEVIVEQHIYYAYACRKYNAGNIETPVVKASRKKNILPDSFATPEAITHIMVQKFVMGAPLYR